MGEGKTVVLKNVVLLCSIKIGVCVSFKTISEISELITSENLKKPAKLRTHKRIVLSLDKLKFTPRNIILGAVLQ